MHIHFCNTDDKAYQGRLNALLKPIFFDFGFWYDLGLWDERYESYSIMDGGEVVSNICVFRTALLFRGRTHAALSLGAVATRESHRGRGLSRALMEHILSKYGNMPMYLSANDSVTGFYPQFGFTRVREKRPVIRARLDGAAASVRLRFDDPRVTAYVNARGSFSSTLDCLNTQTVNLFHLHEGSYAHCLYEIPALSCLIVAEQSGRVLRLHDVVSERPVAFGELAPLLPFRGVERVECGFMPDRLNAAYTMEPFEADPFFVRGIACDPRDFKFPDLSLT